MNSALRTKARSAMRRLWLWYSEERQQVKLNCKVARGKYRCAHCGNLTNKIEINHINPIGGFTNWQQFGEWCSRLFCSINDLEPLCKECHLKVK